MGVHDVKHVLIQYHVPKLTAIILYLKFTHYEGAVILITENVRHFVTGSVEKLVTRIGGGVKPCLLSLHVFINKKHLKLR